MRSSNPALCHTDPRARHTYLGSPRLAPEAVHIFSGYARWAESALARHGLKTADGSPHELG